MSGRGKARLIIPVWGDYHAREVFAEASLRSLLAPGNLPHLAKHLECELRILTESRFIEFFKSADVIQTVKKYANVSYDSIDDLLGVSDYSVPLTLALFRGIEGLGAAVTETYLFFLNADFILADGSYRTVVDRIEAGETLILAPSLRAVAERALPAVMRSRDCGSQHVTLAPRSLVALTLAALHPMPRSKIVNRPFWHPHRIDQFYWAVGDDTLIGFQFPMAVVCVKPEAPPPQEPPCFFDYCSLPVLAPRARRCVLADSDQFFMMEVQSERAGLGHVRPGWPTLDEIAASLSVWTTREQRELGTVLLTFHARDLEASVSPYRQQAQRFIETLTARLSTAPRSHIDHPFWLPAHAFFKQAQAERREQETGPAGSDGIAGNRASKDRTDAGGGGLVAGPASLSFRFVNRVRRAALAMLGKVPETHRMHPLWLYYAGAVAAIRSGMEEADGRLLALLPKGSVFKGLLRRHPHRMIVEYDSVAGDFERRVAELQRCEDSTGGRPFFFFAHFEALDVRQAQAVHDMLRRTLRGGSRILVYIEEASAGLFMGEAESTARYLDAVMPIDVEGRVTFYGTPLGRVSALVMKRLVSSFYGGRPVGFALWGLLSLLLAPVNLAANLLFGSRGGRHPSPHATVALLEGRRQERENAETAPQPVGGAAAGVR